LNCGKKGHWAKNCGSKPKKGKAHVAQTEEAEESSLFFASVGEIIPNVPDTEQSGDGGNPAEDKDYLGLGVNEASDQKRVEILEERVSLRSATTASTGITGGGSSTREQPTI
jgi:hypothetical protein